MTELLTRGDIIKVLNNDILLAYRLIPLCYKAVGEDQFKFNETFNILPTIERHYDELILMIKEGDSLNTIAINVTMYVYCNGLYIDELSIIELYKGIIKFNIYAKYTLHTIIKSYISKFIYDLVHMIPSTTYGWEIPQHLTALEFDDDE